MPYVYSHTRLDKNEVFYIGVGSDTDNLYTRAHDKNERNEHWKNIVANTDYKIEILFDSISWEEALKKEIEFIALYGRRDKKTGTLVNMTDGGEGTVGYIFSDETKNKISKATKGRPSHRKGKTLSQNHIQNLSGKKRAPFSKERKLKMSLSRTGKKRATFTDEHLKNMSISKKTRLKCPYCNLESNVSNIKRYHFEKCKYKDIT